MATGRNRTIGMRKIFVKNYKVVESIIDVAGGNMKKSGRIIINSRSLKDNIGDEARVIVYLKKRK